MAMYLGPPCYRYALNCQLVYEAIPGIRPLCMKKQNRFVLFICGRKSEIQICSNKDETGLGTKNSGEILDKLKARYFNATSLSTYDFSTLYTT